MLKHSEREKVSISSLNSRQCVREKLTEMRRRDQSICTEQQFDLCGCHSRCRPCHMMWVPKRDLDDGGYVHSFALHVSEAQTQGVNLRTKLRSLALSFLSANCKSCTAGPAETTPSLGRDFYFFLTSPVALLRSSAKKCRGVVGARQRHEARSVFAGTAVICEYSCHKESGSRCSCKPC